MTTTEQTTATVTATAVPAIQTLIDGYFECWNSTDPEQRAAAVTRTWADGATSSDPVHEATGHQELSAMFAGLQESYPGHSFRQVGESDAHHQLVRWGWEMLDPEGSTVLDGIDVALLSDDGRIYYLAGFFGADIPAATA
ncbi:MAG: nuclear transport factor 2 family protein [Acidimicrobiales bacterium]